MHGLPVGPPEIPCLRLMGFPQVAQEPSGAAPPEPGCLFDGSTGPRDLFGHPSLGSLVVQPRRLGLSGFGATLIHRIALRTTPDKPDHKSAEREPDSGNERQRFRTQHEARLGRVGPTHGPALHQLRARRGRRRRPGRSDRPLSIGRRCSELRRRLGRHRRGHQQKSREKYHPSCHDGPLRAGANRGPNRPSPVSRCKAHTASSLGPIPGGHSPYGIRLPVWPLLG